MKHRILAALICAFALTACASLNAKVKTTVSMNTQYAVESSYGVALAAENSYKALPLCKTGTKPSLTNICAQRSVIVRLQAADLKAVNGLKSARDFINTYPTVDASNVIAAAQTAVSDIKNILSDAGAN